MGRIEHTGVVISKSDNRVNVELIVESACANCHLKGACSPSESKTKVVEVDDLAGEIYEIGDKVKLYFAEKIAIKMVVLAYVIPVIICILALILMVENGVSEAHSALLCLGILSIYFILLHVFMRKYQPKLDIKIERLR